MRKNENIYAKNKVQKKRKIAAFITKKIENNCLRKAIDLKKSKKIVVGLELLTQSFDDRKARFAPYMEKKFSGRITEELRFFLALLQDACEQKNASTPRIAVA